MHGLHLAQVLLPIAGLLLSACGSPAAAPSPGEPSLPYLDPTLPVKERVEDLLGRMTLAEKVGQMTQVEKNSIAPKDITGLFIGSLLSGGGGYPTPNTPEKWAEMVNDFQERALETRLGIPLIYGVDAVHGHNNVKSAVIFPHNIGLGAARDPDLMERIGRATGRRCICHQHPLELWSRRLGPARHPLGPDVRRLQ